MSTWRPVAAEIRARAAVLGAMRRWFDAHGYLEATTPVMVSSPAMEEHLHPVAAGTQWLRTSPEFALKRVVATGIGRVYEIGPCVRDREAGPWHRREFTMCEWYRTGAGLEDLMDEVESLVTACARALGAAAPSWERTSVREVFRQATGLDLVECSADDLSATPEPWDDAFLRRWVSDVEPTLTGARFVAEWPASQAALARIRTTGEWPTACRFEAYIDGIELANAFLELTDPAEQRRRFAAANTSRTAAGERPHVVDEDFVHAVGRMPRTAGIALGVDRLVASLSGWQSLQS